jgi:hypothetical protein
MIMDAEKLTIVDADGRDVAELVVTSAENGWFHGRLLARRFPPKLQEALDWYDEVVEHQMLSYLDQALASVEKFGLAARFASGACQRVHSLQITKQDEASFRLTPVPPPAWQAKSNGT